MSSSSAALEIWEPRGLYVGLVQVDMNKLVTDLYLEIAAIAFNATGQAIEFDNIEGFIVYSDNTQFAPSDSIKLPRAQIVSDRGGMGPRSNLSEFLVIISQHVPKEVADRLLAQIAAGSAPCLDLDGLNIMIWRSGAKNDSTRLPLWNALRLYADPAARTGKIVRANTRETISPKVTLG